MPPWLFPVTKTGGLETTIASWNIQLEHTSGLRLVAGTGPDAARSPAGGAGGPDDLSPVAQKKKEKFHKFLQKVKVKRLAARESKKRATGAAGAGAVPLESTELRSARDRSPTPLPPRRARFSPAEEVVTFTPSTPVAPPGATPGDSSRSSSLRRPGDEHSRSTDRDSAGGVRGKAGKAKGGSGK